MPATLGATDFVNLVFLDGRGVDASGSTVFLQGGMLFDAKEGQHRPRSKEQKTYLDQALDGIDEWRKRSYLEKTLISNGPVLDERPLTDQRCGKRKQIGGTLA